MPRVDRALWPLIAYFAMAFGFSWGAIAAIALPSGVPGHADVVASRAPALFGAMVTGPVLASLVLTALLGGRAGLRDLARRMTRWRAGARSYAVLLAAPAILVVLLGTLSLVSPSFMPSVFTVARPAQVIVLAIAGGLAAGFFEEIGWSGFATPRLLARYSVLQSGLALGVLWAIWHAAADYWSTGMMWGPAWGAHFLEWIVALTAYRVLMTWLYARTRSVLLAQLAHASFTGSQLLLWPSSAPTSAGLTWYALFALALAVLATLVVRARPAARGAASDRHAPAASY